MSLDLPPELVWAMGMIGLPWPQVEEDQLRSYATHLRTYASSLSDTHSGAHAKIKALSASNSGPSYEALIDRWAHVSSSHMTVLVDGCHVLATALEVAADAVVVAKYAIIAALTAMVAEFIADQAASVATLGLAEAATVAIVEGTKLIVKTALDQLEQMVIAEGLELAIAPLEEQLAAAVQGMMLRGVEAVLA